MAAPPLGSAAERHWTEEKERALIAFFSKHSCLWNHKSESYKNRQLRWKTLEHLRILLSAHPPPVPFTVEDIKNKFKNLRTTFQRQYKMVKASKVCRSDDVFVPQWKHYQQLMFLQGCWDPDDDGGVDDDDVEPLSSLTLPQEETQSVLSPPGMIVSFLPNQTASFPSTSTSSSCFPTSNMMVKCYWTEERERALIAFYSEQSCLWNKKSENHNNRQLRLRLLEALREQLSDHSVSFSVEDLKCKFKNLRTVFNREYKVVQASRASDKLYMSKWKHYQQLLFLLESCDEDDSTDDLQLLTPQEDKDPERGDQTPSSTLSSFSSNSTQTVSVKVNNANARTSAGAAYQILVSTCPDNLRLANQTAASTLPTSPSASPVDTKPGANPSPRNFCASAPVESDSRASADSRCHWGEAKVQQLISFYSEHSCLWNHKSESYRNRLLRQNLLETLSGVLSDNEPVPFTVEDIKTKFRNLRTIFQREHKSVSSNKTCGSEDFYLPKWKHYRDLMFLCDSCDEDERPEGLHFHGPRESGTLCLDSQATPPSLHYHATTQTATGLNIMPRSLGAPPSPTPPDSRRSSPSSSPSPSTSSSHADSRAPGRKRASRRAPPTASEMLDLMRMFCQSQTASPHAGFLKYVEECLNETPPDKVKKLKKKIIETIHSVSEEV
ncbi:uncharacterized protein LOC118285282 [Scophthalmus maximus]|uniref:uncharacterized protein LOC118285282 n=1 Tax=Scophthalmus maximus TaxID=52904 RepID=UPI001FA90A08|nr:uncharacterized protein LOC118285282 [Scophthalmus maximus]XP_035464699.2 uncharacterized protein LOC118285282 [Scophthalmus maximus]